MRSSVYTENRGTCKFEIKSEIEKGEYVADRWRKGEVEKGEFVPGKWRKGALQSGDYSNRRREFENSDSGLSKGAKDDVEKGEFIPDRWQRSEVARDDNSYLKPRRHDSAKDKGWKSERGRTPSSGKYSEFDPDKWYQSQYSQKPAIIILP
ncbi:hypothetical protein L6452_35043 [Arctium lappa]|uniref:Uncharacterized protein n=1 Tax=Arctium lappa TaxID=4217 RepID=A0ACB8YL36_ARCLA|nr:hypothetical protein L6452_35043 [Arctium lappa]